MLSFLRQLKLPEINFTVHKTTINVVTSIIITHDPLEPGTEAGYIQVSSGYSSGLDQLALSNAAAHPSITTSWDATAGKLKISSATGGNVLYTDLESAIKDVVFSNSSAAASGTKTFSITIGQRQLSSIDSTLLFIYSQHWHFMDRSKNCCRNTVIITD